MPQLFYISPLGRPVYKYQIDITTLHYPLVSDEWQFYPNRDWWRDEAKQGVVETDLGSDLESLELLSHEA